MFHTILAAMSGLDIEAVERVAMMEMEFFRMDDVRGGEIFE